MRVRCMLDTLSTSDTIEQARNISNSRGEVPDTEAVNQDGEPLES